MHELEINLSQFGTHEGLVENIHHALSLGLPEFQPSLCSHDGTFVIVGSGPTVKDHIEEIREEYQTRPICAVKGAYDFLVENDIIPASDYRCHHKRQDIHRDYGDGTTGR